MLGFNKHAWAHAVLVGALAAFLSSLATGLPTLVHSPTVRGVLFAAVMAALSKTAGLLVNVLE